MVRYRQAIRCCLTGCLNFGLDLGPPLSYQGVCADHLGFISEPVLRALVLSRRRFDQLERRFMDQEYFEGIWAKGRCLQLLALLEAAHDRVDVAWRALKDDISRNSPSGSFRLQTSNGPAERSW